MSKDKWTPEIRKILYTELFKRFGPYNTWEYKSFPNKEQQNEFKEFKIGFANMVTFLSGKTTTPEAVQQQIEWAVTKQNEIKSTGYSYNHILNVAEAINCEFLQ